MAELRKIVKELKEIDDKLSEVNKQAIPLREERNIKELELADILKDPQYQNYNMLRIDDDGSTIKIQRPNTWHKPWSLSKRELEYYIYHYFENAGQNANRQDCFKFIVEEQKRSSLCNYFNFPRNYPPKKIG